MPAINIVHTASCVMMSTVLVVLGGQACLAAKLSPKQIQSIDNDSRKIESQVSTDNVEDTIEFPRSREAHANFVLLEEKAMNDVTSKSQPSEMQYLVHGDKKKVINNQGFINIAVWTFLRVMGIAILVYGSAITVDAIFRKAK